MKKVQVLISLRYGLAERWVALSIPRVSQNPKSDRRPPRCFLRDRVWSLFCFFPLDFDPCEHGLKLHMILDIYSTDPSAHRIVDIFITKL